MDRSMLPDGTSFLQFYTYKCIYLTIQHPECCQEEALVNCRPSIPISPPLSNSRHYLPTLNNLEPNS